MTELTCIVCPRGCTLRIEERDGRFTVTGNACKRGEQFATAEMTCPTRTLCTTVRTVFPEVPVISVRTSAEIPKDKIFDVMREINRARVTRPMKRGEAVLPNVLGLGGDIIITSGLLEEKTEKENEHEQIDLHPLRRLLHPRPETFRAAGGPHRQVWPYAATLPEGTPARALQQLDFE